MLCQEGSLLLAAFPCCWLHCKASAALECICLAGGEQAAALSASSAGWYSNGSWPEPRLQGAVALSTRWPRGEVSLFGTEVWVGLSRNS